MEQNDQTNDRHEEITAEEYEAIDLAYQRGCGCLTLAVLIGVVVWLAVRAWGGA